MRTPLFAAAAVAAVLVAPRPASAQDPAPPAAAQADVRRPDVATATVATAALVRPAATFRFIRRDAAGLPAAVTLADSAGQLIARYRLDGDRAARPMTVAVLDTDLVLQAESPSGLLTIVLDGQNAPAAGPVTGRWWLGDAGGALRGRPR